MSEMVERVARAVYAKLAAYTYPIVAFGPDAFDKESDFRKEQMREWARCAIEAMREATIPMLLAACNRAKEEQCRPLDIHRVDAVQLWQAMIDEALK